MALLRILISTSTEDIASTTIRSQLIQLFPFEPQAETMITNPAIKSLYTLSFPDDNVEFSMIELDVHQTDLSPYLNDTDLNGDLLIVASRHRSESAQPTLLCHAPGNWKNEALLGGQPQQIAKGSGLLLYYLFQKLKQKAESENFPFPVDREITHHGPTEFNIPIAFVELGSSEKEWTNEQGARIIAETIIEAGQQLGRIHFHDGEWEKGDLKICVGFGGTHYMPNFKRLIELGYCFPHVIPKYAILEITESMIAQIRNRVLEPIDYWVVDWKGINSAEKSQLIPLLEATDIPIKKIKELNP